MPSTKQTILCTGPVEKGEMNFSLLGDVEIDVVPFTAISTQISESVRQQIQATFGQNKTVVFTSSNAVKSVANYLQDQRPDWTIFCIGNTTYKLARKYFGEENIKQTASTAKALAEKIIPLIDCRELTFFCGNLRRNELPDTLRQKGITVTEIVVYYTSLIPVKVEKKYDAVLFFSPSAAESFFSQNSIPEKTTLFVMGKTTAESIKKYAANKIVTGHEPDKGKLIEQAIKFIRDEAGY